VNSLNKGKQEKQEKQEKQGNPGELNNRNLCIPFDKSISICKNENSIIHNSGESSQMIERKTLKSTLDSKTKYKLMNLDTIFVPSMMYGTFCNTIYTTYYDFQNGKFNKEMLSFINSNHIKRVRIRHYYFDPNSYFEIKYKNHKIRVLIDCEYNILEGVDPEYNDLVNEIILQIKQGKIPELFYNEYKRFSFVYKSDPSIRITIDTDIKVKYEYINYNLPFDVLEVKYNVNIPTQTILKYFKEIAEIINTKIILSDFSKVDYTIENIIIPKKTNQMMNNIHW
jgi:hypothetical protein